MEAKANILEAIGKTPVVQLSKITPKDSAEVYGKCEFLSHFQLVLELKWQTFKRSLFPDY